MSAFFNQVVLKHRLDLKISAAKIVATGTFMRVNQRAEVLVSAVAHACIADLKDEFTALAFEPKLLHQPP